MAVLFLVKNSDIDFWPKSILNLVHGHEIRLVVYDDLKEIKELVLDSDIELVVLVVQLLDEFGERHDDNEYDMRRIVTSSRWFRNRVSVIIMEGDREQKYDWHDASDLEWSIKFIPRNSTFEELAGHIATILSVRALLFQEGDPRIVRSIEFPPEYYQSGVTILSYFATVLREKNLSENVKVAIEQYGLVVRLVIQPPSGQRELIERTLDSYALVVTGKVAVEELITTPRAVLELKSQLNMAWVQLQNSRDLLQYVNEDRASLRAQVNDINQALEKVQRRADADAERFMGLIGTLTNNTSELISTLQSISNNAITGNNFALSEALGGLRLMLERGVTKNDMDEFIQKVQIVKAESPNGFERLKDVILGGVSEAGGSFLYDWIKIIIASLPK
jgi:hypothetical protein